MGGREGYVLVLLDEGVVAQHALGGVHLNCLFVFACCVSRCLLRSLSLPPSLPPSLPFRIHACNDDRVVPPSLPPCMASGHKQNWVSSEQMCA